MLSQDELARINARYLPKAEAAQEAIQKDLHSINQSTRDFIDEVFGYVLEEKIALPDPSGTITATDRELLAAWHLIDNWHLTTRGLVRIDRLNYTTHFRPPKTLKRAKQVRRAIDALLSS